MTGRREGLLAGLGRRADLPTYLGGWVASCSWLLVVASTVGDFGFNILILSLTTVGYAVSFWLRGWRDTPQWDELRRQVLVPSAALRLLFVFTCIGPGLFGVEPFARLVPTAAVGSEEWLIGAGFMWAMALYSFGLVTDGLVAFGSVLGLSMLGLMGSSNVNPELGLAFLTFLLGNLLMLSNMTLAYHVGQRRERTTGRLLARWAGDQLIVAGLTVTVTALGAVALAAVLQRATPPLLIPTIALPLASGEAGPTGGYASFGDQLVVGIGASPTSDALVMQVKATEPLLLRRRAYEVCVGRVWRSSGRPATVLPMLEPGDDLPMDANRSRVARLRGRVKVDQTITLLATADVATAPVPIKVTVVAERTGTTFQLDATGDLVCRAPPRTVLQVTSSVARPNPAELRLAPWVDARDYRALLQVPVTVRDSIEAAAAELAAGKANAYDAAEAIQTFLETQFTYDATVMVPRSVSDAMAAFFRARRGGCDMIATAMALLARAAGIPARVAVGYSALERQPGGDYLVRVRHAHAWAELFFPGYGWLPYNPAVPGDAPVAASERTAIRVGVWRIQRRVVTRSMCLLLGAWLALYVFRQWMRSRPRFAPDPAGGVALAYHRAQRALLRRRLGRRLTETPHEHFSRLSHEAAPAPWLHELAGLTRLYERERYLPSGVPREDAEEADRLLYGFRRRLRRWRPQRR